MAAQLTSKPAYGAHGPARQQPPAGAGPQPTQLSCAMLRTWLQRYIGLPALPSVAEAAWPANLLAALARLQPEAPGSCVTGGAAQREQEEVYALAGERRPSLHTGCLPAQRIEPLRLLAVWYHLHLYEGPTGLHCKNSWHGVGAGPCHCPVDLVSGAQTVHGCCLAPRWAETAPVI